MALINKKTLIFDGEWWYPLDTDGLSFSKLFSTYKDFKIRVYDSDTEHTYEYDKEDIASTITWDILDMPTKTVVSNGHLTPVHSHTPTRSDMVKNVVIKDLYDYDVVVKGHNRNYHPDMDIANVTDIMIKSNKGRGLEGSIDDLRGCLFLVDGHLFRPTYINGVIFLPDSLVFIKRPKSSMNIQVIDFTNIGGVTIVPLNSNTTKARPISTVGSRIEESLVVVDIYKEQIPENYLETYNRLIIPVIGGRMRCNYEPFVTVLDRHRVEFRLNHTSELSYLATLPDTYKAKYGSRYKFNDYHVQTFRPMEYLEADDSYLIVFNQPDVIHNMTYLEDDKLPCTTVCSRLESGLLMDHNGNHVNYKTTMYYHGRYELVHNYLLNRYGYEVTSDEITYHVPTHDISRMERKPYLLMHYFYKLGRI